MLKFFFKDYWNQLFTALSKKLDFLWTLKKIVSSKKTIQLFRLFASHTSKRVLSLRRSVPFVWLSRFWGRREFPASSEASNRPSWGRCRATSSSSTPTNCLEKCSDRKVYYFFNQSNFEIFHFCKDVYYLFNCILQVSFFFFHFSKKKLFTNQFKQPMNKLIKFPKIW